ncbi:PEP-CTERM sorting domain-containing protein [Puniceicoccus vermicola]|uniref:PEP-CTERM sorting domain-containing protein n=1 Tax=Puniceicoccus vermicola TaxID=388746 RepID=A0A7X1B0K0_9BACT|nr:PEP-CTERM sorting domain-containing protein [Puniceicoccus vermicola]MBC2603347.1 PEP-CTERM sorting domain-containing protein [Puniceicoccus vermicola]
MKPLSLNLLKIGGVGMVAGLLSSQVAFGVTLLDEDFSDGNRNGWYSVGTSDQATGNTVSTVSSFDSGYALRYYSSYSNNAVVTSFSGVTLQNNGDYVELSATYRYSAPDIAGNSTTGPLLGLYNNMGSPIVEDSLGSESGVGEVVQSWDGYKATKYIEASTGDGFIFSQSPVGNVVSAFSRFSGSQIDNFDGGFVLVSGVNYSNSLRIELQSNLTDVEITYSISGGGNSFSESTIVAASNLTFNEVALAAYSGQGGVNSYLGDISVTSNIPEPGVAALIIAGGALGLVMVRRRRSSSPLQD